MSVVPHSEQDEIVPVDLLASLRREEVEIVLVLLRGKTRLDFAAHAHDRFFRNVRGQEQRFAGHSKVTFFVVRRNTALVSKGDEDLLPGQISTNPGELRVNRARRVAAGKR